ncbi:MAG: hypothetical protein WCG75_10410, partial [Armatimonadota bacterium]
MLLPFMTFLQFANFDIRGPILAYQKPAIIDKQSVQVGEPPKSISESDRGPNIGKWIWCPDAKLNVPARFLRVLTLKDTPKSVRSWITAEVRYRMWINGKLAARGPADSGRDYDSGPSGPWLEDVRDLSLYFTKGENVVAIEVIANPIVGYDASTDQPGLKVDFKIQDRKGSSQT